VATNDQVWEIRPAYSGQRKSWALYYSNSPNTWQSMGYFSSQKAAKAMAVHMARKPITLLVVPALNRSVEQGKVK